MGGSELVRPRPTRPGGARDPACVAPLAGPSALALDLAATLQRSAKREFVRVLEIAAHGQPAGDAGDLQTQRLQQPGEVERRRLTLDVRVRAEDHFLHALAAEPAEQFLDPQLVGPDTL